jgi:hypothetical protein
MKVSKFIAAAIVTGAAFAGCSTHSSAFREDYNHCYKVVVAPANAYPKTIEDQCQDWNVAQADVYTKTGKAVSNTWTPGDGNNG